MTPVWHFLNGVPQIGILALGLLTVSKSDASVSKDLLVFQTNESGAGDFRIAVGSTLNPFGSRYDQVLTWGYNQNPGAGNRVLTSEHAMAWRMENFYNPSAGVEASENHLAYINRAGTSYRLISTHTDLLTDVTNMAFQAARVAFNSAAATEVFVLHTGDQEMQLLGATSVLKRLTNNVQWLQQRNAAGNNYVRMMYVDGSDQVVVGGALAAAVRVAAPMVFDANMYIDLQEQTAPAAPAANHVRIFAQDNGAGKTQLMARFATGDAQEIAIQS